MLVLLLLLIATAVAETDVLVIELAPGIDVDEFARQHGLAHVRSLESFLGHGFHQFHVAAGMHARTVTMLQNNSSVKWVERQVQRQRFKRAVLSDPLLAQQWHLSATPPGMNVHAALAQNVDGTGVTIAVVDDGVEAAHPDLRTGFKMELSHDFNGRQGTDPSPFRGDSHGTSAAGVACARRGNNICGIGVASGSNLVGIRLIAGPTSDLEEAEALSWHRDKVDIISCSWGPEDTGAHMEAPGTLLQQAFDGNVRLGREGKGTIMVWAGGNGAEHNDNCNLDGYANDFRTISVSAVTSDNQAAWYSERCAMHMVTAPSSGAANHGVVTDSLDGRCTSNFGGTSASAPMIAGAIANMLQVNPALTWRDVQGVLAKSALKVQFDNDDWTTNARGYHHSHSFGFGRLDLPATLAVARAWTRMPLMTVCTTGRQQISARIPETNGGAGPINHPIVVSLTDECMSKIDFVESIGLRVQLSHRRRGQVVIQLRDPAGAVSKLTEIHPDYAENYPVEGWLFGSVRHWGARPQGTWSVIVYDAQSDHNQGTLNWVEFIVRGHKEAV